MEITDELALLAECTEQEKWKQCDPIAWTLWDTSTPTIMEDYKTALILSKVPKKYEKIRVGALERSEKYTQRYLVSTNIKLVEALKVIKKKHGWPTEEKFGQECAEGAWLIAQHADHNPEFQQECLQELAKLKTTAGLQQYAYLLDRMLVNKGEPQHFGTMNDPHGKLYPIQGYTPNPANLAETELQLEVVNSRRESVGFLSLQDEQAKLPQFILMQKLLTDSHEPQSALPSE